MAMPADGAQLVRPRRSRCNSLAGELLQRVARAASAGA